MSGNPKRILILRDHAIWMLALATQTLLSVDGSERSLERMADATRQIGIATKAMDELKEDMSLS